MPPGANVIKLFTAVIYRHSMVILSFCVIKHYYYGKYHRMAVNYRSKKFYNNGPRIQRDKTSLAVIYCSNLLQYFNPRISRVKITMVIYRSIVLQHWPLASTTNIRSGCECPLRTNTSPDLLRASVMKQLIFHKIDTWR